jgi:TPR repeat protein/TolB-like protein
MRVGRALLLAAALICAEARADTLAVLALRDKVGSAEVDAEYFTDAVRSAALAEVPGLRVMTRENVLVLLEAQGRSLEQCEGECEVETGRLLGADWIVSGDLLRVGTRLKLDLRLHETRGGLLLSAAQAGGAGVEQLDDATPGAVKKLLEPLARRAADKPAAAHESAVQRPPAAVHLRLPPARLPDELVGVPAPHCASAAECRELGRRHAFGRGASKDLRVALSLFARACDLGDAEGCTSAGWNVERGGPGVRPDPLLAAAFDQKGCDAGDGRGCSNLGVLYDRGRGVAADPRRARELYRVACARRHAHGCTNLGRALEAGKGGEKDVTAALAAYLRACEGKDREGCDRARYLRARSQRTDCRLGYRPGCPRFLGRPSP